MAITKVQCGNGHFYNAEKHTSCPVCGSPGVIVPTVSDIPETEAAAIPETEDIITQLGSADELNEKTGVPEAIVDSGLRSAQEELNKPPVTAQDNTDVQTVFIRSGLDAGEPVVGWMVCISGAHFGESFTLKAGQNLIGRDSNMDICLSKDVSVSRSRHCIIIFEPKKQDFYVQQGEGSGITYLNDDIVLAPEKIKVKDKITLGKTDLLLIPLCADGFRWEDYSTTG